MKWILLIFLLPVSDGRTRDIAEYHAIPRVYETQQSCESAGVAATAVIPNSIAYCVDEQRIKQGSTSSRK